MEPSRPDKLLASIGQERTDACEEHGAFTARNLIGRIWSKCPTCVQIASDRQRAEESLRLEAERERRHAAALAESRIPARFIGRSFDNFVVSTDDQRRAVTAARDYAENFDEHLKRGTGLVMSGMPGNGKSHLASAILQHLLARDVRYITCLSMIRAIRETWRRDSEQSERSILSYFGGLDLLVIDEIGVQYGSDGEQTIIFDVLDMRYREMKPTILLTNQDKAGLKTFIGERTFDRLIETSRWIAFDWESYRPTARKAAA